MREKDLSVKRSTAGLGLFANEPIAAGEFVIEYTGTILTNKEAEKGAGLYLFEIDDDHIIDGKGRGNKARYINHACRPNCYVEIKKKKVLIYALKNIKEGNEISYDYGKSYFNEYIKPKGCLW